MYHAIINISKNKTKKLQTIATWEGGPTSCLATAEKIFKLYEVEFQQVSWANVAQQKNHIGLSDNCLNISSGQDIRLISHDYYLHIREANEDYMNMCFYEDGQLTKEEYLTLPRDWKTVH